MTSIQRAWISALLLWASGITSAQNAVPHCCMAAAGSGWTFLSNVDSARVYIDGRFVGRTPVAVDTLPPGAHLVRIVHPDVSNWRINDISDSIVVASGEERTLRYRFNPDILVTSTPFGADVFLGDSLLGTTPLQIRPDILPLSRDTTEAASLFTIKKHGYESAGVRLKDDRRSLLSVDLQKTWNTAPYPETIFKYEERKGPNRLPLYLSGVTTVISGVAAAYFKTQADDRYALYGGTGDPALLRETNHLDTASAVALVLTQVSFALFTYLILSE